MLLPSDWSWSPRTTKIQPRAESAPVWNPMVYIILISIIGFIIVVGIAAVTLRSIRARHPNPKLIPTSYLKKKWTSWHVPRYSRGSYRTAHADDSSYDPGSSVVSRIQDGSSAAADAASAQRRSGGAGSNRRSRNSQAQAQVDRNASVRSIMTLPAYKAEARDGEQVLGREGERDGIDVVLEMRSAEEEEELRNAEMEQLYQIRLLRRQWNAQREERRVQRREARARGDVAALQRLREEAAAARDNTELDELRGMLEDIKSERDARASVVNYAAVGVARHDGTRIRANSVESERTGLLSDAETMGRASPGLGGDDGGGRNRASSLVTWSPGGHGHRRMSSALSVNTDLPSPGVTRSRANSAATSRDPSPNMANASRRRLEAPAVVEVDLGDEMPLHSPPGYEDSASDRSGANTPEPIPSEPPPGYISREPSQATLSNTISIDDERAERRSSRGVGGVPQLPSLARLPQIVVEPSSNS